MTGAEMLAYVKKVFKRTDKDAEIYECITDTILDIKIRHDFDAYKVEAYSTSIATAGDYKIEIPSDFGHLVGAMRCCEDDSNSRVLVKLSKAEFDELYPNPNATDVTTAMPQHYCLFGEQFLFGPVPDKTTYSYEFSYTTEAVEIIGASTTVVPFSVFNRECVRAGTLQRIFQIVENEERAQYWGQVYEMNVMKIVDNDRRNSASTIIGHYNDL